MENVSDGWLTIYLAVIPITAVAITILFGALAAIVVLIGLSVRAILQASRKSHPITPQEEID